MEPTRKLDALEKPRRPSVHLVHQVEIARLGIRISDGPRLSGRRVRSRRGAVVGKDWNYARRPVAGVADIVENRAKGFVRINKKGC